MSRKEQAKFTKENLFKTAIKLISENGYDNVTISKICEESGVAKGTFYVHFQSKEDILKKIYYSDMNHYVLRQYNDYILNHYTKYVSISKENSLKEKIIHLITAEFMYAKYVGHDLSSRAYISTLSESLEDRNSSFENREFANILKDLIKEGLENKIFNSYDNVDELLLYIESFARGIISSWCFLNSTFDIVKTGEKFIRNMIENL